MTNIYKAAPKNRGHGGSRRIKAPHNMDRLLKNLQGRVTKLYQTLIQNILIVTYIIYLYI